MTRFLTLLALATLFLGLTTPVQAQNYDTDKGNIRSVSGDQITLKGLVKDTVYTIGKDAGIWIDGKAAKLSDLKTDEAVTITHEKSGDRRVAHEIRVLRNAKEERGTVRSISGERKEIVLKGLIKDTTYEMHKDATFFMNGKKAAFTDVQNGDEVLITYEVSGDRRIVNDVTITKRGKQ